MSDLIDNNLIFKFIVPMIQNPSCEKIFVPKEYYNQVLSKFHRSNGISGHLSRNKLYFSIKLNYLLKVVMFLTF